MKIIFIICSLTFCVSIFGQSGSKGKKTITSGTNPLYKANALQVQSQLDVENGSIISYKLNFSVADLSLLTNNTSAQPNTCVLTDMNESVYNGTLDSDSSNAQSSKVYTCSFSKDDFYKITAQKIVRIQITAADGSGGAFSVDRKLQNSISQQGKAMLAQLNAANPQ